MTNTPVFTQTPNTKVTQVTTANTNRDGTTGTYSAAITFGANGGLLDYIKFHATVTVNAGLLRIFYSPDSGTTWRLLDEVVVPATVTPSGTVAADDHIWVPPGNQPLNIPSTGQLKFNVNNAETWNVFVHESDY